MGRKPDNGEPPAKRPKRQAPPDKWDAVEVAAEVDDGLLVDAVAQSLWRVSAIRRGRHPSDGLGNATLPTEG